jgi:hypothetical protein
MTQHHSTRANVGADSSVHVALPYSGTHLHLDRPGLTSFDFELGHKPAPRAPTRYQKMTDTDLALPLHSLRSGSSSLGELARAPAARGTADAAAAKTRRRNCFDQAEEIGPRGGPCARNGRSWGVSCGGQLTPPLPAKQ